TSGQVQRLAERVQTADTQVKRLIHEEREEELSQLRFERDVSRLQDDLSRIAQRDQVLHHEMENLTTALAEVAREEQASRDAVARRRRGGAAGAGRGARHRRTARQGGAAAPGHPSGADALVPAGARAASDGARRRGRREARGGAPARPFGGRRADALAAREDR